MRHKKNTFLLIIFIAGLALFGALKSYALGPTIVIGVFGEYSLYTTADSQPESVTDMGLQGFISYRKSLPAGGYLAVSGSTLWAGMHPQLDLYDMEYGNFILSLPLGNNSMELNTSVTTSLLGIDPQAGFFIEPEWQLLYRFERGRRAVKPYLAYQGSYLYQQTGAENRLFTGGEVGFTYSPKVELSCQGAMNIGVEHRGEQEEQKRQDTVIKASLGVNGLLGFFVNWSLTGNTTYRLSSIETNNSISGSLKGALSWSPKRHTTISLRPAIASEYLLEPADDTTNDRAVIAVTNTIRVDHTSTDWLYFYAESGINYRNGAWNGSLKGGVDISF